MVTMPVPDNVLTERLRALVDNAGNVQKAAQQLGISESAIRRSVREAASRNLTGDFMGGPLPSGYIMGRVTSLVKDGETVLEWQRKEPTVNGLQTALDDITQSFLANIKPIKPISKLYKDHVSHWLTLYPMADVHLGQHSWGEETGENYDLRIAKQQFTTCVSELVGLSPPSEAALVVLLGDFFHADNESATTERSGNHLDVDGRHDKVLRVGVEMALWIIETALGVHDHVYVHVTRGNHDKHSSKALSLALDVRYRDEPRVTVLDSPRDLWVFEWGSTMLAFTHGDMLKAEDMPGAMAAKYPVMWGRTTHRYAYSGHFHKSKKSIGGDERFGAKWEILPAFTAKDAWNDQMGFSGGMEIMSITFDKEAGRKFTNHVTVR